MKARFTVITQHDVLSFDLEEGTVILGRDRSCDHPLKDPTLERRHLALTHDGNRITATDLQTRAGTVLNGNPVERTTLHDGDRMQIGESLIIASAVGAGESTAPGSFTNATPMKRAIARKRPSLVRDDERFFIRIAKEWGLVNRARMRAILFVKHNNRVMGDQRRVEEICVRKGYLTVTQVREIIAIWERMVVRCRACNSVFTPRDLTRTRRQVCPNCGQPLKRTLDFPGDAEEPAALVTPAMEEGRALNVGEMFGGCRVDRFLAEGGSAEVYEGTHIGLSKKVAIKVLKRAYAGTAEHAHRFVEEARRVARLEHPHIVQVFNVGYEKNRYFIVYQFVEGRTLAELLARYGKLPPDRARYIAAACAAGLSEAHRHGIIHRDVKPENILVGRNRIVKVTDFGIAKDLRSGSPANTEPGMGTYLYLAPEQERDGPIDQRCDVYSLGLVLRYMLTGQKPPEGHRYVDIPSPREANPEIGESLSAVVVKMLAKNTDERYGSMKDVLDALRLCEFEEALPASQPEPALPVAEPAYHVPMLRAATLLLALGAAGLGGAFLMMPRHEREQLIARGLSWFRVSAPAAVPQEPLPATPIGSTEEHVEERSAPHVPLFTPPESIR
ncbi:MAG: protein kinase, partial [Planctomycetota bacterium]